MPFDDALLWCPDNDGRMVDISACLQDAAGNNGNGNQEMTGESCELNALEPLCTDSSDELFRQLTESSFELENLLSDFTTAAAEVKQEDNNNNLNLQQTLNQQNHNFLVSCTTNQQQQQQQQQNANFMPNSNGNVNTNSVETAALLALAASVTANSNNISQQNQRQQHFSNQNSNRYSIAANPLLAEKLLSPASINDLESLSLGQGNRNGRPPDLKGKWNL